MEIFLQLTVQNRTDNIRIGFRLILEEISVRTFDLLVPCHFGLEAVLKREIYDLGYEITKVEDGRVTFEGDEEAICRANIFLRTAERVMIRSEGLMQRL